MGYTYIGVAVTVTLHVSVWVEIYKNVGNLVRLTRHAPRERVSWNINVCCVSETIGGHAPRERVSWNESLIVKQAGELKSRSTWACELKLLLLQLVV